VGITEKVFRVKDQKSSSDSHRNLVNSIASELLKKFESKRTQIRTVVNRRTD